MSTFTEMAASGARRTLPRPIHRFAKKAYRYLASLKYFGNRLQCPFCKGQFSMFLPAGLDLPVLKEMQVVGGGFRLNSTCPRCYSGDRERLLSLYLRNAKTEVLSREIKILHVAPEENLGLELKSRSNITYLSADLSSPWVDIKMDITDINQDDETFDVIICNHVLEHIPDDRKAMRELFRVLKKGGFAILQVPISHQLEKTLENPKIVSPAQRELHFGQEDHVRIYGMDYSQRLTEAGFNVRIIDYAAQISPAMIAKYRLLPEELIFEGVK